MKDKICYTYPPEKEPRQKLVRLIERVLTVHHHLPIRESIKQGLELDGFQQWKEDKQYGFEGESQKVWQYARLVSLGLDYSFRGWKDNRILFNEMYRFLSFFQSDLEGRIKANEEKVKSIFYRLLHPHKAREAKLSQSALHEAYTSVETLEKLFLETERQRIEKS